MDDQPITNAFQNVDTSFGDVLAHEAELITIVAFQVPNCKMKFADDPEKKHRAEDSQLAWSLHMFLDSLDPNDMLIYPMAKASLAIAKAAIDYEVKKGNLDEGAGTVFQGASKRGWAMWMVGASVGAKTDYPPVLGILPMVPIVPDLVKNLHRQWMAYEGFSFAFEPYMKVGLLDHIDDEATQEGMRAIDPFSFKE